VASTDAAAVFSVMGSSSVNLRGRLEALLEMESGSNDPMAVFLTIGMIGLVLDPAAPVSDLALLFVRQMGLGAAAGWLMGRALVWAVNRAELSYEGLYPVLTVALMLFTYGLTTAVGGNGFLAVYLAGLIMGQHEFIHRRSLKRFHDGLGWLAQVAMFLTLGLLVVPSELVAVADTALLLVAFLIFIARPASVMLALLLSRFTLRERLLVAWVGLRGAAPIILATFPLLAGIPRAGLFFNLVFFVTLSSVVIQGPLIVPIARRLGLLDTTPTRPRFPLEFEPTSAARSLMVEVIVPPHSVVVGQRVIDLALPEDGLIVLIGRAGEFLVPGGSTHIEPDDTLLVLADRPTLDQLRARVETRRQEE
jgi:cell volume regulation protein A